MAVKCACAKLYAPKNLNVGRCGFDMLIDLHMTYATRFQLTLTTTKLTLLFDPEP